MASAKLDFRFVLSELRRRALATEIEIPAAGWALQVGPAGQRELCKPCRLWPDRGASSQHGYRTHIENGEAKQCNPKHAVRNGPIWTTVLRLAYPRLDLVHLASRGRLLPRHPLIGLPICALMAFVRRIFPRKPWHQPIDITVEVSLPSSAWRTRRQTGFLARVRMRP